MEFDAVEYNSVRVRCPRCRSARVETRRTMPAEGGAKMRYHRCRERGCRALFKSVEVFHGIETAELTKPHPV